MDWLRLVHLILLCGWAGVVLAETVMAAERPGGARPAAEAGAAVDPGPALRRGQRLHRTALLPL